MIELFLIVKFKDFVRERTSPRTPIFDIFDIFDIDIYEEFFLPIKIYL